MANQRNARERGCKGRGAFICKGYFREHDKIVGAGEPVGAEELGRQSVGRRGKDEVFE